ncbi:hypothetical protein [Sphingomonas morindae]|uniref:Uncharacterized protein n=1 Tax=Sphingomonas morindae TaxID=1541170 RepID=A0ABY4X6R8_9SPHN|nr:hypothetical protein [Sphingomonas morindae]USI72623.1 hypothetical protein LHA26_15270 [Sphingomonas morindae]
MRKAETARQLRERIARAAEAATGRPRQDWLAILGPIWELNGAWRVSLFYGDAESNRIAHRIAAAVADQFDLVHEEDAPPPEAEDSPFLLGGAGAAVARRDALLPSATPDRR